ncbi:hypothetical protein GGD66_005914 [Bradyrhizobium sp. CIR48]|uniref:hypothetical protein n=1 Tax=Bradyrhizobium sp. CIR48 TaxID=2663840 RepID=UPI0016065300|nr:hypothetical protein [Bradyrhizobium sp. CIR48]MBB4427332.1 hypothetical protein [Bradyrhizobium sp. CIR48]
MQAALLAFGLVGIFWSAINLPAFWSAAQAREAVVRLLAGDRFKPGALGDLLVSMAANPAPVVQRSQFARAKSLIRLRIAEEVIGRESPEQSDQAAAAANDDLKFSLTLNPEDSFLWLMLYSVETTRKGFDATTLGYLDQSYATGPLEGWVAAHRNRLSLASLPQLSPFANDKAVSEFAAMVDGDLLEHAAVNLMTVGWVHRERLLASLNGIDLISREIFARRLARDGIKISIPGVQLEERLLR